MIIIDTSALVAIILEEPLAEPIAELIANAERCEMSVANYTEAGMVLARRSPTRAVAAVAGLDRLIRHAGIALAPVDEAQARMALEARIQFGKGFGHPAQLNYGDCFAYALAKVRNAPLLYVGGDFAKTDIAAALA